MRLTLRNMLAYLDNLLEPAEAESIVKKIEESQYATELLDRLNDVKRRLRLAAPRVDGRGMGLDANTVAEYLNNTMPGERVPDFERVCLESDVHLAEVAACHEILTLVLGEPVEVDSALRERMYALINRPAPAEAAPAARQEGARHETPAPSPAKTPPPLDLAAVNADLRGAVSAADTPLGNAALKVDSDISRSDVSPSDSNPSEKRKREVPEYLRQPPRKKRGSPVLALVALLVTALAIGFVLTRTEPGKQMLAQLRGGAKVDDPQPGTNPANNTTNNSPTVPSTAPPNGSLTNPAAPPVGDTPAGNTPGSVAPSPQPATGSVTPANNQQPTGISTPTTTPGTTTPGTTPGVAPLPATAGTPTTTVGTPLTQPAMTQPVGTSLPATVGAPAPLPPATGTAPLPSVTVPPVAVTTPVTAPPGTTPLVPTTTAPGALTPRTPLPEAPAPAAVAPAGPTIVAMGTVTSPDSLTAVQTPKGWKRLPVQQQISSTDKIRSLPGYRTNVGLATGLSVQLWGGLELEFVAPDARNVPGLYLYNGRMSVTPAGKPEAELRLGLGTRQGLIVFGTPEALVAVEVRPVRVDGQDPTTNQAPLVMDLLVVTGEVKWIDPANTEPVTIKGPARLSLGVPPTPGSAAEKDMPGWLSGDDRSEQEKYAAPVIEEGCRGERALTLALKELADHRRNEVRLLAVRSLVYLGDYEAIVAALRDVGQNRNWDTQCDALSDACAQSPDAAGRIKHVIEALRGPAKGGDLFRMLWGYTPVQFRGGAAATLVKHLDHEDLDFRVLAFWNLRKMAPKVQSLYRPEQNTATRRPAVIKWEQLLDTKQLFPKEE